MVKDDETILCFFFFFLHLNIKYFHLSFDVAMSFPASGLETTYRNNLREVAKLLQKNHQDKYMVQCAF